MSRLSLVASGHPRVCVVPVRQGWPSADRGRKAVRAGLGGLDSGVITPHLGHEAAEAIVTHWDHCFVGFQHLGRRGWGPVHKSPLLVGLLLQGGELHRCAP